MGSLFSAVIIAVAGVSCLSLSHESRMVVPQAQFENAPVDGSKGVTFSPKEIQIPAKTGVDFDEPATSETITADCTTICEPPSSLDSKLCRCVAEKRSP